MKTTIDQLEDRTVVTLEGDFDTAASVEVEKTLRPLIEDGSGHVVIECEKLTYIASSGLRILLSLLKSSKAGGGTLLLRNVNENVMKVFILTGFVNIFKFE
jgi:anti-anti-sigma factor